MLGRIVDISDDNRHVSVYRGFMVVEALKPSRQTLAKIALDDIAAVIVHAHGMSYSNNLLVALLERQCPLVICASNHAPVGMVWPIAGHHQQAKRFDQQVAASLPTRKRLWAQIVKAKLMMQAQLLSYVGQPHEALQQLARTVQSGDVANHEAQAARRYWPLLLGQDFRRDQQQAGVNGLLNYGYTVLRSAMARSVVAAGLHPTLGLHHSNESNAMRLVDDLMEPFRPWVDAQVWLLQQQQQCEVDSGAKKKLVDALYQDVASPHGLSPVTVCCQRLATSLAQVYAGERKNLELPTQLTPIKCNLFDQE